MPDARVPSAIALAGLAVIETLTASIGLASTPAAVYEPALDALDRALGVRRAAILLFDPDHILRFKAWRGLSDQYRHAVEAHAPWDPDTAGASLLVVPDAAADPRFAAQRPANAAEGIVSIVFVPLKTPGGAIGTFALYFDTPRILSPLEQSVAGIVAGQVAFAVQRLRAEHAAARSEQASRFLANGSRALAALTDLTTTLQTVARVAVPDFADWCAADIVAADGTLRRLALLHWDPSNAEAADDLARRYPPDPADPYGPYAVLRSGRPSLVSDVTDAMLVEAAVSEEHLRVLRAARLQSLIGVPLTAKGQIVGALTFITADSGRRYGPADLVVAEDLALRAGVALENAQLYSDLQHADRQKDEFLAVLAHELRNPLAPIRTALQLARLVPDDPGRRDRAFGVMDRQLHHLVRLVDDLLDVSRITRGRIDLQIESLDLAATIRTAVDASAPVIDAAEHRLDLRLGQEPVRVAADHTRLAQVFANLLNNAAKYTPRGGQIAVTLTQTGRQAMVTIADSGVGIPPDMLTGIFDMFTQVDRSLEKTHGGLGIGLTLAKRLVEMHGGTLEARSDGENRGSEFIVRLPALATSDAAPPPAAAMPDARVTPARRILVADDNHDAADCLAELLRMKGHQVRVSYDGLQALAEAEAFTPDVVFLDLGMPRLNGYDAARRLRAGLGSRVLLVAITGWGQAGDRRQSAEAGFDHHLVKPVDVSALDTVLTSVSTA